MATKTKKVLGKIRKPAARSGVTPRRSAKARTKWKSDDEFLEALVYEVRDLPSLTFIASFPDHKLPGGLLPLGPSLTSAVDLVVCKKGDHTYNGPYFDSLSGMIGEINHTEASKCRKDIVGKVKSRLHELRQRGIKFAICWCAYGGKPELDWLGDVHDPIASGVYEQLADSLKLVLDLFTGKSDELISYPKNAAQGRSLTCGRYPADISDVGNVCWVDRHCLHLDHTFYQYEKKTCLKHYKRHLNHGANGHVRHENWQPAVGLRSSASSVLDGHSKG
jgi:hypothetical protein